MADTLTSTLTREQLTQNIDALQAKNVPNDQIQKYVNQYKADGSGGYSLGTANTPSSRSKISKLFDPSQWSSVYNILTSIPGTRTIGDSLGTAAVGVGQAVGAVPGGLKGANETLATSPGVAKEIGAYTQAASLPVAVAAAPTTIAGAAIAGGALGAAQAGGKSLEQGNSLGKATADATLGGIVGAATGGALSGLGKMLGAFGEKELKTVIKPSRSDIEDGFSMETIKKYDLGGTLHQTQSKTEAKMSELASQLSDKLKGSNSVIDLEKVYQETAKDVVKNTSKLKTFGANTRIENALQGLQGEVAAVHDPNGISIPDAQVVKQASGQFGAWQYGKPDPEAKASEVVYNAFYRNLKKSIEDNSPAGVQDINKQLSELIPVSNAIIRRLPVAERNAAISLTDFIGLTASAFEPRALGITLLNLASKSGSVGNALMKYGPKTAKIAPAVGAAAARMVGGPTNQPQPSYSQPQ